jgi:integrase
MRQVISDLPKISRSRAEERKDEKWITDQELIGIPEHVARARLALERRPNRARSLVTTALLDRNEIVFRLLTWVPLRRTNLCELMLGSRQKGGNVFKSKLRRIATLDKPAWVIEQLRSNPDEQFWQLYIPADKTKNGQALFCILPKDFIPFLEEYLARYRPILYERSDSGPLFPSSRRSGKALTRARMYAMIVDTCFRYTGKPVNPHLIRDIGAVGVLDKTEGNLATASRWLGHKTTSTTDQIYASKFNLSHAVRKVEELREMEKACPPQSPSDRNAEVIALAQRLAKLLPESGLSGVADLQVQLARLARTREQTAAR